MAACATPFMVTAKDQPGAFLGTTGDGGSFPVPCGKCPECLKRRASGWSFRLMQEEKTCSSAQFITLTYDTTHVPITSRGFMSLRVRDVQLFFKRLRKSQAKRIAGTPTTNTPDDRPIKYYAVGEYGSTSYRPHYHIILFNADITLIQSSWQLGSVYYGCVSGASVGYCLKYMCKPPRIPMHSNDDRKKEFSVMSKGLGKSYLTDAVRDWHEKT